MLSVSMSDVIDGRVTMPFTDLARHSARMPQPHVLPRTPLSSDAPTALATWNLYSRIRRDGLSARVVWTQRYQITAEQLPITDRQLNQNKNSDRPENRVHSAKSKAQPRPTA